MTLPNPLYLLGTGGLGEFDRFGAYPGSYISQTVKIEDFTRKGPLKI